MNPYKSPTPGAANAVPSQGIARGLLSFILLIALVWLWMQHTTANAIWDDSFTDKLQDREVLKWTFSCLFTIPACLGLIAISFWQRPLFRVCYKVFLVAEILLAFITLLFFRAYSWNYPFVTLGVIAFYILLLLTWRRYVA